MPSNTLSRDDPEVEGMTVTLLLLTIEVKVASFNFLTFAIPMSHSKTSL